MEVLDRPLSQCVSSAEASIKAPVNCAAAPEARKEPPTDSRPLHLKVGDVLLGGGKVTAELQ